jgi:hypothetical protein
VTFYEILIHVGLIIWILIGGGLIVGLLIGGPQLLRTLREFDDVADVVKNRVIPVLEHSDTVLDQLGRVTNVLLEDIEVVDDTIIRAAESIERMVELTEERVSEVNALVSVAIEEAEDTFLSTASLLRAVRAGGRKKRKRRWLGGGERRRSG